MWRAIAVTALAAAALPGRPALAQQAVDQRRTAASDGLVEIENPAGSIRVLGWSKAEVGVTGTLGRRASLNLNGGGRRTHVEVEVAGNPHGARSEIEVHVPAGSRVSIESFAASITVAEVTGPVTAETVNGSVSIDGSSKEVSAEAVNGSVEVSGSPSRVHAGTVNGALTIRGARGDLEANTVNGELRVTGGGLFERAHLETVSGAIRFEGALAPHAELDAQTVSGSIELDLPAGTAADFTVNTFSGDINTDFGAALYRSGPHSHQKELTFSIGGGGAKVTIETLSGSIVLRKR
ncbi:MAG: hypothetical protein DMF80_19450 [Acidobacteria bacterium]|nr:MAG: hypothetical protein DMF80_19450 [Acidobacteriota bacterium]PYQ25999.1 MAG: hypothetical protein DMF81_00735 [Acidobacteriota bacterium]